MRRPLWIAVLCLAVISTGPAQQPGARNDDRKNVEEMIRNLDNERIQAQIHADRTALDRLYAEISSASVRVAP
jgi:hypothetical protein